jgi:thiosulfate reductase cytochrome b subunit
MDEQNQNSESLAPENPAEPAGRLAPIQEAPEIPAEEEPLLTGPIALSIDEDAELAIRLRKKHALATRWMHWINFPLLGIMIWSGLMIYWADSDASGLHAHEVYRIGVGDWTLFRFFPDWFYDRLHLTFSLARGLGWHFFFMWLFAINGILYVLYTLVSGAWRQLLPDRRSLTEAWHVVLHDLHLSKRCPPAAKYNGAQRISYTAIVLSGAGSLVTGLAIYKPTQLHALTWLLGGYEYARFLHFWLTVGYVAFFVIHVLQVARAGWNNFRGMVTGYELVREERS